MDSHPPKTPPAWFAQYQHEQHEHHKKIKDLESKIHTNELAWGHSFGRLCDQVKDMFDYIKEKLP